MPVQKTRGSNHLFVYGTLRRSAACPMHRLLHPVEFVGMGKIAGEMYDLGNYPGAIASENGNAFVHGEVYAMLEPGAILARLDRYEGCAADDPLPHEYVRVLTKVCLESDERIQAWVYCYSQPMTNLRHVPSGDWLQWQVKEGG